MRRYRAIDKYGVMHAVEHRGATLPLCVDLDDPEPTYVSQWSFPCEEPLTCTGCMSRELKTDLPVNVQ